MQRLIYVDADEEDLREMMEDLDEHNVGNSMTDLQNYFESEESGTFSPHDNSKHYLAS
jgi:hypothetical protein